jgi:hypothetical protein
MIFRSALPELTSQVSVYHQHQLARETIFKPGRVRRGEEQILPIALFGRRGLTGS